jgi:hypothetical protein
MTLDDAVAAAQKPANPFALKKSDFKPFGIGLWKYCWRSTAQAKMLGGKAEDYELRDTVNSTLLCAYSVVTIVGGAAGIRMLYDWFK